MTNLELIEELQKCKDSPVYFYNKYVRKEGQKELTEAEYEDFVKQVEYKRNMPLKLRKHYKDKPLLPSCMGEAEQLLCSCDNPNGFKEMEQGRETCSKCKKPY